MLKQLLLFLTILCLSFGIKVQCEYEPSSWKPGMKFQLNEREAMVPTIYNLEIIVDDLDGTVSKTIKETGSWEPRNIRTMAKFLSEGGTILNIGAHVGLEAIVLGRQVGPKGRVFLFEPIETTYNILVKNIYLNQMQAYTTVYKIGASNAYSTGYSQVRDINTGGAFMNTDPNFKPKTKEDQSNLNSYRIVVDRADKVLPSDAKIDFALIDTERLELQVLEGLLETIARSPNMAIMCEWWPKDYKERGQGTQMETIVRWLKDRKYRFYYQSKNPAGNCNDVQFIEQSFEQVMEAKTHYSDIFFVPGHVDPNKL